MERERGGGGEKHSTYSEIMVNGVFFSVVCARKQNFTTSVQIKYLLVEVALLV